MTRSQFLNALYEAAQKYNNAHRPSVALAIDLGRKLGLIPDRYDTEKDDKIVAAITGMGSTDIIESPASGIDFLLWRFLEEAAWEAHLNRI